ncbi:uncharacterized protein LOC112046148 isoform X2 [Bicyclus anynana]|uniref:Uncharacterized protein LOC112046148 isoform X2 n=1 Tax=Bicyclus anynana TaxID=110368 RepID=A0ABM3M5B2_BICAN|nr:uncharacterized protein LOC112046148 isoform X2 [Bicyclus anynana]
MDHINIKREPDDEQVRFEYQVKVEPLDVMGASGDFTTPPSGDIETPQTNGSLATPHSTSHSTGGPDTLNTANLKTCLHCGRSVRRRPFHPLNTDSERETRVYNVISQWLSPVKVELSTSCICHPCWKKADKASQEDLATSTSQPPTHNHTNHSNSIALPNYCRAIATSSRCFVRGCQKTDRSRVTDSLRKKILDKYNYYIPQNNRLCKVHEKDQSWVLRDKEDGNSLNVFTAVHIQDMFSLSSVRI